VWSNDDTLTYRTARQILEGKYTWLEEGILGAEEMGRSVREAMSKAG
jgi:hypothetical protein